MLDYIRFTPINASNAGSLSQFDTNKNRTILNHSEKIEIITPRVVH